MRAVAQACAANALALAIQARRGVNVAAVALANQLARIAWAVLARDRRYRADWAEQSV